VGPFDAASFAPFGLDARWTGPRWFGGSGRSDREITRLELAHGEGVDSPDEPLVRVTTRRPQRIGRTERRELALDRAMLVQELLDAYAREAGSLPDPIRRAAFPTRFTGDDPTGPWDDTTVPVDGAAAPFKVLEHAPHWWAVGQAGDELVGIEARHWPLADTGLVAVTDLGPYEQGWAVIQRRLRDRP
jgi:hypothetical protein